jgi:hypothetical protein
MARYALGALLFGLVWASIAYIRHGITDFRVLAANVLIFVILGTAICWLIAFVIKWIKSHQ